MVARNTKKSQVWRIIPFKRKKFPNGLNFVNCFPIFLGKKLYGILKTKKMEKYPLSSLLFLNFKIILSRLIYLHRNLFIKFQRIASSYFICLFFISRNFIIPAFCLLINEETLVILTNFNWINRFKWVFLQTIYRKKPLVSNINSLCQSWLIHASTNFSSENVLIV